MKIKVVVSVDLVEDQIETLTKLAIYGGHSFDQTKSTRKLIRRYLESKVCDAITYCKEHIEKD